MASQNFADLDPRYAQTPPELVGVWPLGGGGIIEAPYRHHFELREFLRTITLDRSMHFLELGSGNGRWALSLAPGVASYIGVDITPRAVAIARARADENGLTNTEFICDSISNFRSNQVFDVVYFSGVSQYLDEPALTDLLAVLAPNIAADAWIVDRSTISTLADSVVDVHETFSSTLRTVPQLSAIYGRAGGELVRQCPSYRAFRGGHLLCRRPLEHWLAAAVRGVAPVSLHLMLAWSWIFDQFFPVDIVQRGWSHDFLFFRRTGRS